MMESFDKPRIISRSSLQTRFLLRVLFPPFLILVVISIMAYLLLSSSVKVGEIDNLRRVAETTSAKLGREFALRKTVLRSTGSQLFALENDYAEQRTKLDADYKACRSFMGTHTNFASSPSDVCEPFYAQFAVASQKGMSLQQAVDEGYAQGVTELSGLELGSVNEQLGSYVRFFPETSRILVIDKSEKVVSQSLSGGHDSDEYLQLLSVIAKQALEKPVEGVYADNGDSRQMIFAYPIDQGAVLASYDIGSADFLYPSWKSAPIDNAKAYVAIVDTKTESSYPEIKDRSLYTSVLDKDQADFVSSGISYLAVSAPVSGTSWRVVVSSPSAIALEPLINTQILAVAVVGVLLVSFLWVGSRFVRRTADSILGLVGGALIFSTGRLEHRIDTTRMSDKEFSQLADIMNNMAVKIQEAEAAIDQKNKEFINVATHEIKAPITGIIGNLSMMLDDGMGTIDDTARQLSTQAYKGTVRLRELVNELLDIARLESGRSTFELKPVDLTSKINDMIDVQRTPAAEKGITVEYRPPSTPTMVLADTTKIEIVLTNFISNGIKYNRPHGKLTISHTVKGGQVQIDIQDTGLGIPADQQAKMFQKFFRVEDSDRSNIPGTGLGMFITKQFIEGMGGKLWFESEHGRGTTFHFTLSLAEPEAPAASQRV